MTDEPAADSGLIEGGSSRQLVIALPGPLAVSSLAQDAREAGRTVAPLVVVARAAVLAPQHGVVAHPSCRKHKTKRGGEGQEGRLMDQSGIRRRRASTGEFTGHKPPRLVPSASICVLKAQLTRRGGRNQRLPLGSKQSQDAMPTVQPSRRKQAPTSKEDGQFHGFIDIFRATKREQENPG